MNWTFFWLAVLLWYIVSILAGAMPRRQQHLILAWAELHHEELSANWDRAAQEAPLARTGADIDPNVLYDWPQHVDAMVRRRQQRFGAEKPVPTQAG